MKTRSMKIGCENGLHLRVAAEVVRRVQRHKSAVGLACKGCPRADACSIIELMMLGAGNGTEIEVEADGSDEDEVLNSLYDLFEGGSGI